MNHLPARVRSLATVFSALLLAACSDVSERITAPSSPEALRSVRMTAEFRAAVATQERHTPELMRIRGVVGTAVGLGSDGQPVVQVFVLDNSPRAIPATVDGVPTHVRVTGMIMALSDPLTKARPAPLGFSVGHPAITAGTIGALVVNGSGATFALSNNHVLANSNDANIGDPTLQPGPFDGGTVAADQIGTLAAFRPIDFSGASNQFDAAIAATDQVLGSTPADDGYGAPAPQIFDDANNDRVFDNIMHLVNVHSQKYGRTTKLTKGTITGVNATLDICYEVVFIFCVKSARFTEQLVIAAPGYSSGGDSGSLIVTDDANKNPLGLLFAGSSTETIANRIDHVLNYFNVSIAGSEPPPPPDPVTDVGFASISAPLFAVQGATVNVNVTVRNVGNQPVGAFDVSLADQTDNVAIGTQAVAALAAGASTTLSYSWNTSTATLGAHTLVASHTLIDDNPVNNSAVRIITINPFVPTVDVHVGDLDGFGQPSGSNRWQATVEATVHDANHAPLNGATVVGRWTPTGLASDTCTTGELGGNGSCIFLFPGLRRSTTFVTFTVQSVTIAGRTYQPAQNHDPDGSSNGTTQRVNRP